MAKLRSSLTILAAALYVLLGISASWHAPHFSRGETTVGVDRHAHHEAVKGQECALCAAKPTPHVFAAGSSGALFAPSSTLLPVAALAAPGLGALHAARARAPPALS